MGKPLFLLFWILWLINYLLLAREGMDNTTLMEIQVHVVKDSSSDPKY
jgi:hypothetical protein